MKSRHKMKSMHIEKIVFALVAISVCTISAVDGRTDGRFKQFINRIEDRISHLRDDLDKSLHNFVPELKNFVRNLHEIALCYESELVGHKMDIFNKSLSLRTLVQTFYTAFPNKTINRASIHNLLDSTIEMVTRCSDPRKRSRTVKFGFTELSDRSIEDITKTLGERVDSAPLPSNRFKRLGGNDVQCVANVDNLPGTFDWRHFDVVTPVRDQGECGSCWAFATALSIESSYLIHYKKFKSLGLHSLSLSPQMLVDCVLTNGCSGSNGYTAMNYIKQHGGIAQETKVPYVGREQSCPASPNHMYSIKDFCARGKYTYTSNTKVENLSDKDIQESLVQFGPLYITVDANPSIYRNYRSGVVSDSACSNSTNHAVLLVGFTSDAWIVKNSWGPNWGEAGYFRLARGNNMCGINSCIAWPIL